MSDFEGFQVDQDNDDIYEVIPDIEQHELEEIFQSDNNQANQTRRREGLDILGKPVLDIFARTKLIVARSAQLQLGVQPLIPRERLYSNELQEIAIQELNAAIRGEIIFPIKIRRNYADGTYEIWTVADFNRDYNGRDAGGRSQRSRQRKLNY
jgi:DNA-directed RNA polymerase subunit K/omega